LGFSRRGAQLVAQLAQIGDTVALRHQTRYWTFAQRRHEALAAGLDHLSQGLDPVARGFLGALLGLIDDLGQRDAGEVLLGPIVDDLHVLPQPYELGDLGERHVAAFAGVVELTIRVALDDAGIRGLDFRVGHGGTVSK
jgi:hypothetical protein